ncbi:hypothetical protein VKT23_014383 [Stygiomarasmius scandens]|uniref:Uncharacterized protein n=1 Tax=Marasmiellus scandens TaxID=2682957 RepID=A0ABR1J0X5_9AGAR
MSSVLQTVTSFFRTGDGFLTRTVKVYTAFCNIFKAILIFLQELYSAIYPSNGEADENERNTPVRVLLFKSQLRVHEHTTQRSSSLGTMVSFVENTNRFLERCGKVYAAFCGIFRAVFEFVKSIFECFNPDEGAEVEEPGV